MCTRIETLGVLFDVAREWEKKLFGNGLGFPMVWYRGHADARWELQPTVLRKWFIDRVFASEAPVPDQVRLAHRERTINNQFRRMAASLLHDNPSFTDVYFLEQHHGMPTRLLDWTTSPIVALFFAVCSHPSLDGKLYAMNPRFLIPNEEDPATPVYPPDVVDIRHPIVEQAICPQFGQGDRFPHPLILPILPDLHSGRLLQQSSCFTLHLPPVVVNSTAGTPPAEPFLHIEAINPHFQEYVIPAASKSELFVDLRRAGINYATIFPDLDNVSREIRTAWSLYP